MGVILSSGGTRLGWGMKALVRAWLHFYKSVPPLGDLQVFVSRLEMEFNAMEYVLDDLLRDESTWNGDNMYRILQLNSLRKEK